MGKLTISMALFKSYVSHYQMVDDVISTIISHPLNHHQNSGLNPIKLLFMIYYARHYQRVMMFDDVSGIWNNMVIPPGDSCGILSGPHPPKISGRAVTIQET